jgi:hypothetical protein
MAGENKIRDAADAIKGVVQAVPVDQDALQPLMRVSSRIGLGQRAEWMDN